mgnify:CR=1 FL=1
MPLWPSRRPKLSAGSGLLLGLAGEARVIAETMHDLKSRRAMLFIAASCESMAKNLENAAEHLSLPIALSPRLSP